MIDAGARPEQIHDPCLLVPLGKRGGIIDSKLAECVVHLNQPFENVDAEESVQQALPYGSHVELPLRTPIDENASVVHDEKSSTPIESK